MDRVLADPTTNDTPEDRKLLQDYREYFAGPR